VKELIRTAAAGLMARLLEAQSRPLVPSDDPVLFVAPHADDEALGGAGLLIDRAARRRPTGVVFLSDSAAPHPSYGDASRHEIAARRQAEARSSLAVMGVEAPNIRFLDAPDGRLDRLVPAERERLQHDLRSVLDEFWPRQIFVPFLGGGSSEHDAAYWIVWEAVQAAGSQAFIWEYPIWAWWNPRRLLRQLSHPEENFRLAIGPHLERKTRAIAAHRSQIPLLPAALVRACRQRNEFYFRRMAR
jgi:LmbE family N-acetylglucosaminyl deacetylase